jgi:hypothetical protein
VTVADLWEEILNVDELNRARLRGLGRNPAISDDLFRRLLEHPGLEAWYRRWLIVGRTAWTDEAFDALAAHPDPAIRADMAQSLHSSGIQRARLVGDPDVEVRAALAAGPDFRHEPMPDEAYRRLVPPGSRSHAEQLRSWLGGGTAA